MKRRATLAIALVATLLLGASPAAAAQSWSTRLTCADGEFTGQWTAEDDMGRLVTWLAGWIEPCEAPDAGERFGLVYFVQRPDETEPRAYVVESRLRPYDEGRTSFEGAIDPAVEEHTGPLIGVCLAYAPGRLVACDQPPQRPGQDLPPLPPLPDLSTIKVTPGDPYSTQPNCATCV